MIENYIDLRLAVSEYVGDRSISDVFDRLVSTAEKRLNRVLRHKDMLTSATVTFTNGSGALPTDFIEMRHFKVGERELTQQSLEDQSINDSCIGYFAVEGSNITAATVTGDQTIRYYAKLPTLVTNDTNWLLNDYPDVYEYGVAYEAARLLRNRELAEQARQDRDQAIRELMNDSDRAEWGGAVVRVKGVNP